MKLQKLLEGTGVATALPDSEITALTDDSRRVTAGCVYACLRGEHFDGHTVAGEALEKGACVVLVDHDCGLGERQIITDDTRRLYGEMCAAWFGHPERKMKFIGVTGTNGKTTITNLIKAILTDAGHKVGLIGTIQNEIGTRVLHTENTTPFVYDLFELYAQMEKENCDTVVMEVSSFALVQERLGPTHFALALFTNLTQDHLDYHADMEDYYRAKKMLFGRCDRAIINCDDAYGMRLIQEITCPVTTFSLTQKADFVARDIALKADGTTFVLDYAGQSIPVTMRLCGKFNVSNAIASLAASVADDVPLEGAIVSLSQCMGVRGRCEVIPTGRDFTVICDYAHTPDAVENILRNVRETTTGRLICLFGCGGNRDAKKRPKMAQVAAKYADFLVITSDNPRDESPEAIIDDILTGLDGTVPYEVVVDRREAILKSMQLALAGDVIVLAGKGHEDYQVLPHNVRIPMDEREIVRDCLPQVPVRGQ